MRELRTLLALALPIMLAQIGQMTLTVVDILMVGRLGVESLDAAQLGHTWVWSTAVPVIGIVMGMDPLVSQAHGAHDRVAGGLALQRGIALSLLLSVPLSLAWWHTEAGLLALGQAPGLSDAARDYVRIQLFSAPFPALYTTLSTYLQARGIVRPPVIAVVAANVLNATLNYLLIFGAGDFAGWGLEGAGLATACTRVALVAFLGALIVKGKLYEGAWTPWSGRVLALAPLGRQLGLGAPVGLQYSLEMWAFALGTVIAGMLDPISLGAHSIAITLVSYTFMVPLGISIGASARVGNLIGAGEPERAQVAAWVALRTATVTTLLTAALFFVGRHALPRLITNDEAVLAVAATIFPIAGAFQVLDALQAVGGGILRGMGRPRPAAVFNLVGYFVLALPLAYWLALDTPLGVLGVWLGYAVGLAVVALCLMVWIALRGPRTVSRLAPIDAPAA